MQPRLCNIGCLIGPKTIIDLKKSINFKCVNKSGLIHDDVKRDLLTKPLITYENQTN